MFRYEHLKPVREDDGEQWELYEGACYIGHVVSEEQAQEITYALNLIAFMQKHLPETYKNANGFYESCLQAQNPTLVAGVETVDGISEAFPAKRDTPTT